MPKTTSPGISETSDTTVRCPACDREQSDRGQRSTCVRCGISPLPSFAYPRLSQLHPSRIEFKKERSYVADRR